MTKKRTRPHKSKKAPTRQAPGAYRNERGKPLKHKPKEIAPPEVRRRPPRALKRAILEEQDHRCLGCGVDLIEFEFDHVIALALGGSNGRANWTALCPGCHKTKTAADLKAIAKAKRLRRYALTGRSRALRSKPLQSRGFDDNIRRHLDGSVSVKR